MVLVPLRVGATASPARSPDSSAMRPSVAMALSTTRAPRLLVRPKSVSTTQPLVCTRRTGGGARVRLALYLSSERDLLAPHHFAQSSTPLCTIWVIRGTIWVSLHAAARWDRETITIWVMIDTIWVVWSTIWEEGSAPEPCLHTICLPTPTQITRRNIGKLCDVIRSEVSFLRPRPSY